jgi:hypothetical protein
MEQSIPWSWGMKEDLSYVVRTGAKSLELRNGAGKKCRKGLPGDVLWSTVVEFVNESYVGLPIILIVPGGGGVLQAHS